MVEVSESLPASVLLGRHPPTGVPSRDESSESARPSETVSTRHQAVKAKHKAEAQPPQDRLSARYQQALRPALFYNITHFRQDGISGNASLFRDTPITNTCKEPPKTTPAKRARKRGVALVTPYLAMVTDLKKELKSVLGFSIVGLNGHYLSDISPRTVAHLALHPALLGRVYYT